MEDAYKPEDYWDERFRTYGHTGWNDRLVYAYDQPLRMRAINKALSRAGVSISDDTRVLDVGCGTGDLVLEFAKVGAHVTGVDISSQVLEHAKKRLSNFDNAEFLVRGIEDADFTSNNFDIVTSITVLQHITGQEAFSKAISNIVRMTKENGHILILELSPINIQPPLSVPHLAIRTRREWISAFEGHGCSLVGEVGLPQMGVQLSQMYDEILKRLYAIAVWIPRRLNKEMKTHPIEAGRPESHSDKARRGKVATLIDLPKIVMLKIMKPFDSLLAPFSKNFTALRIMIFRKLSRAAS